jgi:hypothetical protein
LTNIDSEQFNKALLLDIYRNLWPFVSKTWQLKTSWA